MRAEVHDPPPWSGAEAAALGLLLDACHGQSDRAAAQAAIQRLRATTGEQASADLATQILDALVKAPG